MKFRPLIIFWGVCFGILIGQVADAATPTASQLQMLQNLSPEQQKALAKQYGVKLPSISSQEDSRSIELEPTIMTRKQLAEDGDSPDIEELLTLLEQDKEEEIKPFGYEIFEGAPTSFSPVGDLPVPDNYLIGPGDEINVQLYGKENESYNFIVGRDGQIDFPKIGPVNVIGQSFGELQKYLTNEITRKIIGVDAYVSLGELRAMPVFVLGDAFQPGSYTLHSLSTVSQALMASGGIKEIGSLRNIQLRRKGKVISRLDLYDFLLNGRTDADIRMQAGDAIFIPAKGEEITVMGKVRRPAIYELKGKTTLANALKMAGGLLADSYKQDIAVKRFTESGIEVFNLNMDEEKESEFVLKNGDEIEIKGNSQQIQYAIEVKGEVNYPGRYKWSEGVRVSDLLSSIDDDLKETTDLSYALVVREINIKGDIELYQFDLAEAILGGNPDEDIALQQDDTIIVFSDLAADEESDDESEDDEYESAENELGGQTEQLSKAFYAQVDGVMTPELMRNFGKSTKTDEEEEGEEELTPEEEEQEKQIEISKGNRRKEQLESIIVQLAKQASFGNPIKLVEVDGAVRFPGTYPLTENQKISDLLVAAGGIKESANLSTGELSRVNTKGSPKLLHMPIKMEDVVAGQKNADLPLRSKDRVLVFNTPEWEEDYKVILKGEVKFPGTYSINRGELLGDVLKRAGGVTSYANPKGAIFSREDLKEREKQELKRLHDQLRQEIASMTLRRQNNVSQLTSSPTEALSVVNELSDVEALGRLVIDLDAILQGSERRDIQLEDGDMLFIPPLRKTVTVVGQVQSPSTHYFDSDVSVDEYIGLAGGMKKQADKKRVYIVHADGSVSLPKRRRWFSRDEQLSLGP